MAIASHIFCFPKAGSGGGGAGVGGPIDDGWIWQDDSQHEWQDGSAAIWFEDAGGGTGVEPESILWENADLILWENGDYIVWE